MDELLADIKERMEQLKLQYWELGNKENNHIASMILGEIDGLQWVLDYQEEKI